MVDVNTLDNTSLIDRFERMCTELGMEAESTKRLQWVLQQRNLCHVEILRRMGEDVQKDADKQGTTVS